MHLRCLSSHVFYNFVDCVVHRVNTPHGPLNQCKHWREVGGSSQNKMTDEPSDVSEVANNSSDVTEQVPGKKRDAACNKRDASVLEKLKTSSVEDIVLDETKTQILSIAGVDYLSLSAKVQLHFCREMGIMVPNKKRKKEEITELILNHVNRQVLKEIIKQPMKKKAKAAKTRPAALMKDGMLYRIINVICSMAGRPLFLKTKQVMSCATLDSGDKNMSLYEGMADLYEDMTEYNMIDVVDQSQMVGFGVEDDAAIDFDQLNPLEFKECLEFILAHYREACNNKNKSGNHQPFADYTSRKPYLLYLHLWSTEIGDKAFSDCAYSTLPSETSFSSSTSSSLSTDDTTPEKSSKSSSKHQEQQSATKRMMDSCTNVAKSFVSINKAKEEWERSKQERDQLVVFLQLKNDVFEKNQLHKTAKKELEDDPDDVDKHEAEKDFRTTVNFLRQKYEKMKKQVGYKSE